jgi:hypothetical protein
VRIHISHHAAEGEAYGQWLIEELGGGVYIFVWHQSLLVVGVVDSVAAEHGAPFVTIMPGSRSVRGGTAGCGKGFICNGLRQREILVLGDAAVARELSNMWKARFHGTFMREQAWKVAARSALSRATAALGAARVAVRQA